MVLRGVPEALRDRISQILLEIAPDRRIVRILIEQVDGSSTEYRFNEQKENVPVADTRFEFRPPPGTETVEGELEQ